MRTATSSRRHRPRDRPHRPVRLERARPERRRRRLRRPQPGPRAGLQDRAARAAQDPRRLLPGGEAPRGRHRGGNQPEGRRDRQPEEDHEAQHRLRGQQPHPVQPRLHRLPRQEGPLHPRLRPGTDLRRRRRRQARPRQRLGRRRQGRPALAPPGQQDDDAHERRRGPQGDGRLPERLVPDGRRHVRHALSRPAHARGRLPPLLRAPRRPARLAHQPRADRPRPLERHAAHA